MGKLTDKILLGLLLLIVTPICITAASLPQQGAGSSNGYYNGSGSVTQPILQRQIKDLSAPTDGVGGWTLNDQSPVVPYEFWTNSGYADGFLAGDTIIYGLDSISLWEGSYWGFLEMTMINDDGNDSPLGAFEYFSQASPLSDGIYPLLILVSLYGFIKTRKKKTLK